MAILFVAESMITLTAPSTPRATQPPLPLPEMDVIEPKRLFSDEEIVDVEVRMMLRRMDLFI